MAAIETYTTDQLPPGQRISYWNDWIGNYFSSIETSPAEPDKYSASLLVGKCAGLTVAEATSTPAVNRHTRSLVTGVNNRGFLLHLQTAGTSTSSQDGRYAILRKGDFTLCDNTRPYAVSFSSAHRIMIMRIPESALLKRIADAENLMCIPVSAATGINNMVSRFMRTFWKLCQQGVDPNIEGRLVNNVLDLLATSYAESGHRTASESSVLAGRRHMIKDYIEQNLHSPELSVTNIAKRFGYSTSYIHQVFKGENETISNYITHRRVEEAARLLGDGQFAKRTISEIAYSFGFNSLTHFGRVFREFFGVSPSEYRSKAIQIRKA